MYELQWAVIFLYLYFFKAIIKLPSTPRKSRLRSLEDRDSNVHSLQGRCFYCNQKFSANFEELEKKKRITQRLHRSQVITKSLLNFFSLFHAFLD